MLYVLLLGLNKKPSNAPLRTSNHMTGFPCFRCITVSVVLLQGILEGSKRLRSLHCLTTLCELHCLTTVNYVHWFPLLHHLKLLLWLNNGTNYGTHCCTYMFSTVTQEWSGYHGN
jgi:hypothetical protein